MSGRSPQVVCASRSWHWPIQDGTEFDAFRPSAQHPSFPLPPDLMDDIRWVRRYSPKNHLHNRFSLRLFRSKVIWCLPATSSPRRLHDLHPDPNPNTRRRHLRSIYLQTLNNLFLLQNLMLLDSSTQLLILDRISSQHQIIIPNHLTPQPHKYPPQRRLSAIPPSKLEQAMQCSQQTQTRRLDVPDGRIPTAEPARHQRRLSFPLRTPQERRRRNAQPSWGRKTMHNQRLQPTTTRHLLPRCFPWCHVRPDPATSRCLSRSPPRCASRWSRPPLGPRPTGMYVGRTNSEQTAARHTGYSNLADVPCAVGSRY